MKLLSLALRRRSLRKYSDRPISRSAILKCVEAARVAPSAQNVQPWSFIIIQDREKISEFSKKAFSGIYTPTNFAAKAAAIAVLLVKPGFVTGVIGKRIQDINFHLIDIGIAGEHFILQAEELGIGTCWIGWFNINETKKFFKIPARYKIVSLISMGYPEKGTVKRKVTNRKSINELLYRWI